MKLFYRELGEGNPLVLLHGVFGASDNLLTIAKLLAGKYKVYIVDARNHGQSPHNTEFTYEAMADDLCVFIEEKQLKKPVLVGHSMGGKTVMKFAATREAMAEKFIILDISPRYYPRHHDQILEGLNAIDVENIGSRGAADKKLAAYIPELGVRQFLLKNLERTEEGGLRWKLNLPVITEKIENIGEGLPDDVRVTKPILFIRGGKSGYIREEDKNLIHKLFVNARIETVENADHWLHAEQPEQVVALMENFIETSL